MSRPTVFRVTGLLNRSFEQAELLLRATIEKNLLEEEKQTLNIIVTVVSSCNSNNYNGQRLVALVDFECGIPNFLSALVKDPLREWQVEIDNTGEDISFDCHFHGFTQLYNIQPSQTATADIIAITGLSGHAYGSWRGKGNLGRMWLRHFLSKDLPQCRTMIYGYNSKLSSRSIGTIEDYSREFLEGLKKVRGTKETRERPLFFIAHSFGGIILARCLVRAAQTNEDDHPTLASLYKATYGILFFAVPHKGLIVDDIKSMLDQENHPRKVLLEQISRGSDLLIPQLADFKDLIRDRKIITFYETEQTRRLEQDTEDGSWARTGPFITALDTDSATLQLPINTEVKIPIHADHSTIVKFDGKSAPGYEHALAHLKDFERDAPNMIKARFHSSESSHSIQRKINMNFGDSIRQKTLDWLSPIQYEKHHNINKCDVLKGTGLWIFEEKAMDQWRYSGESSVLWLHGISGSGKTKLTSIVVEKLLASSKDKNCLAYFYCTRNTAEPERSNPEDITRSIVRQMAAPSSEEPILGPAAEKYREREKKGFADGPLRLEESVDTIIKLTAHYSTTTIMIDALDECDKSIRYKLLKAINSIIQDGSGLVKIFISSRDDEDIVLRLGNWPNLHIKASDNAADIYQYVQVKVMQAIDDRRLLGGRVSENLRQEIIRVLTKQAQGMFRWVSLQLQNLCSSRIHLEEDLRQELGVHPRDLMGIYTKIYEEISNLGPRSQIIAERSLKWILCSQRSLSVDEFLAAVSVHCETTTTNVSKEDILHICRNLIIFDAELNTFRFAHPSVREFLESQIEYSSSAAHSIAAERCLIVWLENVSECPVAASANNTFHNYATLYWGIHCQMSGDHRSKGKLGSLFHDLVQKWSEARLPIKMRGQLRAAATSNLLNPLGDKCLQQKIQSTSSDPPDPIFAACVWGFTEIIQDLLKLKSRGKLRGLGRLFQLKSEGLKKRNIKGETCLHCACVYGHYEIVQLLVNNGANLEAKSGQGGTALDQAAANGHEEVVRLLAEKGADIQSKERTALFDAAYKGHEAVVRLLLEKGARKGKLALVYAAGEGHEAVVRLLLEKGADVEAKNDRGWTALLEAAWGGYEAVARLLLEKGADIEAKDGDGSAALHVAASWGRDAVVQLLLDKGANVNGTKCSGATALHKAAERGHEAIVRKLLDRGADVNAQAMFGGTALHKATLGGYESIVALLLKKGADVEAKDHDGKTALYRAVDFWHERVVELLVGGANFGQDAEVRLLLDKMVMANAGETALHWAARKGNGKVMRVLLENGADVEARDDDGQTALHSAALNGHETVVRLLLEKGVDVDIRQKRGWSVEYESGWDGHGVLAQQLLEKGADFVVRKKGRTTKLHCTARNDDETILQLLKSTPAYTFLYRGDRTALHFAAYTGHAAVVQQLLENGADMEAKDMQGMTALDCAMSQEHEAVARLLVEKGFNIKAMTSHCQTALHRLLQKTRHEQTVLHQSAASGEEAVVQLLVETGADVEAKDSDGWTALHHAAYNGYEAVVRLLLEHKADVNVKDNDGCTALHRAATRRHEEITRLLLGKGADIKAKDNIGFTALHWAAALGDQSVVQLLLGKGPDVDAKDTNGQTALHKASYSGYKAVVRLLFEKGADVEAKDSNGRTALHEAAHSGEEAVVHLLLVRGADIEAKDSDGLTALHHAAENGRKKVVQLLLKHGTDIEAKNEAGWTALHGAASEGLEKVVGLLVEKGADVEAKDSEGRTALHKAANNGHRSLAFLGHKAVVQLLLEKGADVEAKDSNGRRVLHEAAHDGYKDVVQMLLKRGADLEAKDSDGRTALHEAASSGHEAVVRLLVEHKADVDMEDNYGKTALHWAAQRGHEAVVLLLEGQRRHGG